MGATTPVILKVETPAHGRVVIDASDGSRYEADLGSFSSVYCYPKTREAWDEVTPDSSGYALVWTSRFEVHVDQVIALASHAEPIQRTA
jgi:hypothetical protein